MWRRFLTEYREDVLCVVLVFAASALVLYPILLFDRVPIDAAGVLDLPPWAEARDAAVPSSESRDLDLQALSLYPSYVFLSDTLRRDDSLLWNPTEYAGVPFFAAWKSRCLSVFTIPFSFFAPPTALQISAFLKVLVAGLCAYYMGRRLGHSPSFALAVGVAFQLGAHVTLGLNGPLSDVVPWLPLFLLFAERMALGQSHHWPAGAIAGALMFLGGEPEAFWGATLFFTIYVCIRLYTRRKTTPIGVPLVAFAGGIICAVALASVQFIPYLELARHLVPETEAPKPGPPVAIAYVGVLQILLAGLWCAQRHCISIPHRRRIDTLLISSVAIIVLALGFGRALKAIPLIGNLGTEHLLVAVPLAMALAAAATAEAWLELDADQCRSSLRRLAYIAPALILPALILSLIAFGRQDAGARVMQLAFTLLLVSAGVGLMMASLFKPSLRVFGYGIACVTILDLFVSFHSFGRYTPRESLFPETPFIQALKKSSGRIGGSTSLTQWPLAANGVVQARGTGDVVLARYDAFIEQTEEDPLLLGRAACDALLLTKHDIQGAFAATRARLHIREVFPSGAVLFETLGIGHRAWMAYDARSVNDFDQGALDSSLPPLVEASVQISSSQNPRREPRIFDTETNVYVPVDVRDAGPGILVLADAYYPGWKASIDGEMAEVFAVDGAFRGVVIPETAGLVEFWYDPVSFKIGLGVTGLTAVIVAGGFVVMILRRHLLAQTQVWPSHIT